MAGSTASFKMDAGMGKIRANVANLPVELRRTVSAQFRLQAARGQAFMKKEARWIDRTGNARNRLKGSFSSRGGTHQLSFTHGVSYGKYLETRWAGRYAIIGPTTRMIGRDLMTGMNGLFSQMRKVS